jgi:hypothetical protein
MDIKRLQKLLVDFPVKCKEGFEKIKPITKKINSFDKKDVEYLVYSFKKGDSEFGPHGPYTSPVIHMFKNYEISIELIEFIITNFYYILKNETCSPYLPPYHLDPLYYLCINPSLKLEHIKYLFKLDYNSDIYRNFIKKGEKNLPTYELDQCINASKYIFKNPNINQMLDIVEYLVSIGHSNQPILYSLFRSDYFDHKNIEFVNKIAWNDGVAFEDEEMGDILNYYIDNSRYFCDEIFDSFLNFTDLTIKSPVRLNMFIKCLNIMTFEDILHSINTLKKYFNKQQIETVINLIENAKNVSKDVKDAIVYELNN